MNREDIIRMAREAGFEQNSLGMTYTSGALPELLERFAGLVAAAEREACASICDQRKIVTPEWQMDQHYNQAASHCAQAIRLRGRT
jgi:hypothetical protein